MQNENTGWSGGFDVVLGNPPWERIQPEALKFFAHTHPELSSLKRSDRNRAIDQLAKDDPVIFNSWLERRQEDLNLTKFLKTSLHYPLSTTKNINSYAVFQELALQIISEHGYTGMVLQSGIATDEINKDIFRHIIASNFLESLFDYENRQGFFPDVDSRMRFCLLTCRCTTGTPKSSPTFAFGLSSIEDLHDHLRRFTLSSKQFTTISPNTGLCPTFRTRQDAELVLRIYTTTGVFIHKGKPDGNPWSASIRRIFSMAYDSGDFIAGVEPPCPTNEYLRVFEAKLFHQFDHHYASYRPSPNGTFDCYQIKPTERTPEMQTVPQLWASRAEAIRRLETSRWSHRYLLGYRDVTNATNERTCIASILPESAPDDTIRIIFANGSGADHASLAANLNAFVLDYAARNVVASTHLSEYLANQLPVLPQVSYLKWCPWSQTTIKLRDWFLARVLELVYTSLDLESFARSCQYYGPPFCWIEDRRFWLRSEIDAAFFHLYLPIDGNGGWCQVEGETAEDLIRLKRIFPTPRDAVQHIMETFPIVKRKDEQTHGCYRTKDKILEIYDQMGEVIQANAAAVAAGRQPTVQYQTALTPPPGPPADATGNFIPIAQWDIAHWPPHIHLPKQQYAPTQQIEEGLAVLYTLALLYAWQKPVDRRSFELGILLMQKDNLRNRIINRKRLTTQYSSQATAVINRMDEFIGELVGSKTLQVEETQTRQLVKLGAKAPGKNELMKENIGKEAFAKAEQVVSAISILNEQSQSLDWYMGADDYETVEIAVR